ncbi:MAG: hypothetical protein AAF754_12925 [Pseudomonadota bacterium]
MSDTDSFIDEVTEEVRRDKLYGYLRKYGWIGIALVILIVAGTSYSEYRKAQAANAAQALGDAILSAYQENDQALRADKLAEISSDDPRATAALDMIVAAELAGAGDMDAAAARLSQIAENGDVPEVYRLMAGFKALLAQTGTMSSDERAEGFGQFAIPGNPFRLLAEEQLALVAVEKGENNAAVERLQAILNDAEVTAGLQQRAMQVIVALGGEPDLSALTQTNQN